MSILKINNWSEKSFVNYTGPESDREFKRKNILFGYNGRGKSSLASGIINEFLSNPIKTEENYRSFNRQYINTNLLLDGDDASKLRGVAANFGEKDVYTEKQIKILQKEIMPIEELKSKSLDLNEVIINEIKKIHNNKKGKVRINFPSTAGNFDEIQETYHLFFEDARKLEPKEDELIKISGDNSLEEEKIKKENLYIPSITIVDGDEVLEITKLFDVNFSSVEIPSTKIIEWLNSGLQIHTNGDDCKFCGNKLNYEELEKRVSQYNLNEKQKAIKKLENFAIRLETIVKELNTFIKMKENIITSLEADIENAFEILINCISDIENIYIQKIRGKVEEINKKVDFQAEELNVLIRKISDNVQFIKKAQSDEVADIDKKISKLSLLIKGAIYLEIKNNTLINKSIEMLKEKNDELEKLKKSNDEKEKRIEDLKLSKSNTKDFADHISAILSMIEINLKLEVSDNYYIIKQSKSDKILRIEDMSEGEQNILALLYFYYELFEDNEQKRPKSEIELVIVDDPISSMDNINKMFVLELMKNLLDIGNFQLFIFTHSWEDFCNICYGKKDKNDTDYRFYEIKKVSTGSYIVEAKYNISPYKHAFKEIYEFSLKDDCGDMDDCEIYHYPNVMRKILEEFLAFKMKNYSPTANNSKNIIHSLCGEKSTEKDRMKVSILLNVCNILSHKASRNPDEILMSAKFLMKKIENIDKQHFDTNKQ